MRAPHGVLGASMVEVDPLPEYFMLDLQTKADLQQLVDEGLEESLTLDYKDSRALTRDGDGPGELCKDVSALANSAGGQLIYGIQEDKATRKPSRVDEGVVDPKITREWIEQILNSRVQPRMIGVTTTRIDLGNGQFAYVITVPPTQTGPHQAPDQKYYRRFDLQSVPMHDYEIKDIMRRADTPALYVSFSFPTGKHTTFDLSEGEMSPPVYLLGRIGNRSAQPASHVFLRIGISTGISLSPRPNIWTYEGPHEYEGLHLDCLYQRISAPPALPIFREMEQPLDRVPMKFHLRTLVDERRWPIRIEISTPGFSSTEVWYIHQNGTNLRLLHPGHPLLR